MPPVPRGRGSTALLTVTSSPLPYKEGHPGNFKAVMDAMLGASTHQPLDDVDTVERPGELDDVCCKIVS